MCRKILLSGMILIFISGCAVLQEFVKKPEVSFEDVSLKDLSLFEVTPVFKFKVTNSNPMGIDIKNITYDLKINNKPLFKDVINEGIKLPANGAQFLEVPVKLNFMDVFETVIDFMKSNKLAYDITGTVGIGPFNIPYHKQGEIDVPKMPKISLKDIKISKFSFSGAEITVKIELENNNSFPVDLTGLDYSMKIGGNELAKGVAALSSPIEKNGTSLMDINLNLNFLQLGTSLANILTKPSEGYELVGAMKFNIPKIGEKSFPFQKTGEVPLLK
ncbi:MAG: LEA type 2 family protein [Desulfobacterales bacterium]|nr:LEA type 2 family protein [Desulfobacterales bacterium]